eukprot:3385224-Pleurochrysis_carterae.AAC.1
MHAFSVGRQVMIRELGHVLARIERRRDGGRETVCRPYAKGRGDGRGVGWSTNASGRARAGCRGIGAGRKRSRATARRGVETGGAGDGSGRCVSCSTLATAASPPEGPGWGSTSPAR